MASNLPRRREGGHTARDVKRHGEQGPGRGLASAIAVAWVLGAAGPARAAPLPDDAPRVRVEIDAAGLGDAADAIGAQIDQGATDILAGNGLSRVTEPDAPVAQLTITNIDGDRPGYRVDYVVAVDGATVPDTAGFQECRLCTETELVESAQASIEALMPTLRELGRPASADDPQAVTDDPTVSQAPAADPAADERQARRGLGGLGKAGIAVAVVGGAALIPGIALAVIEPAPLPDAEQRNTFVPGVTLAAVGGAALVTGVALIVVDVLRAKRARATAAVRPTLLLGRDFAAIAVHRRF